MALRGMLTQNIDKNDSPEYSGYTHESKESVRESLDSEIGITCEKCGRMLPEGSRFCNFCGAPLTGKEPTDYSGKAMSPFTSPAIPSAPAPASAPPVHGSTGINDLGALHSSYACAYGILISDILTIVFGAAFISLGIYISQNNYVRLAAFLGYNPYGWITPIGFLFVILGLIDLLIRKNHRLEIYEYGIRGKGSTGWLGYRMKPFQFRFDELIKVEKKTFMFPGVYITAGNGEVSEYQIVIRHAKEAVDKITSTMNF